MFLGHTGGSHHRRFTGSSDMNSELIVSYYLQYFKLVSFILYVYDSSGRNTTGLCFSGEKLEIFSLLL